MNAQENRAERLARTRFPQWFALVLLACLAFSFYGSWVGYFYDVDTPRYASASWEMAQTGDYLRPMDNGVPRLAKPPLPYWLTAPCMQVVMAVGGDLAVTPMTARIPAVLAAVAAAAAAVLIGRRLFGHLAGLLAGLALCASVAFHLLGYLPRVDVFFAASLAWASYFMLRRLQGDRRASIVLGAAAFTALGVLCRGPFAFYPLNAYLLALAADGYLGRVHGKHGDERNFQELLTIRPLLDVLRREWRFVLACAAIGYAPFFLWMYLAKVWGGVDFWAGFVQQVEINTTAESTSFWDKVLQTGFYGDTLIFVFYPWGGFLLGVALDIGRNLARRRRETLFFVFYVAVVVLSAVLVHKLKSHRYVIAALPWLAVWIAGWLLTALDTRRKRILVEICTYWTLAVAAFFLYRWWTRDVVPADIYFSVPAPEGWLRWALIACVALFAALCAWGGFTQHRSPARHVLLLVLGVALATPFYHLALPKGDALGQGGRPSLGRAVGERLESRFGPDTLVANTDWLALDYPDVQFFQKRLDPSGVFYSLTVKGQWDRLAEVLQDPSRAARVMAAQYPNHNVLPAWNFLKSREFDRAVLVLREEELHVVNKAARLMDMELSRETVKGFNLKFHPDKLHLVRCKE